MLFNASTYHYIKFLCERSNYKKSSYTCTKLTSSFIRLLFLISLYLFATHSTFFELCLTREREAIYFAARCLNIVTTGLERGVSMPSDVTLRLPRVLYPAGSLKKAWFPVRNDANCSTKKKLNHSIQRRQRPWGGGVLPLHNLRKYSRTNTADCGLFSFLSNYIFADSKLWIFRSGIFLLVPCPALLCAI